MTYLTLIDLNLSGKTVLYRGPFNLPLDEQGNVSDDYRVKRALPSLEYLLNQGAKVVLVSHLGRPEGKFVEDLRVDSVGRSIEKNLKEAGRDVTVNTLEGVVGNNVERFVREIIQKQNEIIQLGNTRFYPEEESNDSEFSRKLASSADVFVYDAPSDMHRKHASIYGVTEYLVSAAGFLMDKEIKILQDLLDSPSGSVAILGGNKVEGKFETIEGLVERYSKFIIGGAMANTFLAATGFKVGASEVEAKYFKKIKELLEKYNDKILLPVDVVQSDKTVVDVKQGSGIKPTLYAYGTGPKTNQRNMEVISNAQGYVIWNGPFGFFEEGFIEGTHAIAKAMSDLYSSKVETIILGGDTYYSTRNMGKFKFNTVITGGGSSLRFLAEKGDVTSAPGLQGLVESYQKFIAGGYGLKAQQLVKPLG